MTSCVVHIGYHKTGSTWLQREFFPKHPGLHHIFNHDEIYEFLVRPHELDFDPRYFQDVVSRKISVCREGVVPVISSEILVGSPFTGARDSAVLARRLAASLPDAHIVVVLRNQIDSLCSLYKQFILGGGVGTKREFFEPLRAYSYNWFSTDYFLYDRLLDYYRHLFGEKKVSAFLYEDFADQPRQFVTDLCKAIGVSAEDVERFKFDRVHPSLSYFSTRILRQFNRFEATPNSPFPVLNVPGLRKSLQLFLRRIDATGIGTSAEKDLKLHVSQRFEKTFSDSNARLSSLLGRPILDLGYR